jgi:hypothetical protein
MVRHGKYEPGQIPSFWKSEMTLGRITELEYYKHIYPRTIIKSFLKKLKNLDALPNDKQVVALIEEYREMIK